MSILSLNDVVKRYGQKVAVDHINLEIPKGKIYGLLGPNGAGKTSLIRIITTITKADEGNILLDGNTLNENTPMQIGYMPEERGLYKKMKVGEQLLYLAMLKGMKKKDALEQLKYWFEKFDIIDWWNKKVDELSKGMQQKVQFISTVVHKPKLLILDEPFSGLDPINTNLIKSEIMRMRDEGISVILSTHRMEQVEELCEEIALVNNGKLILSGEVAGLRQSYKKNHFSVKYEGDLVNDSIPGIEIISNENNQLIFHVDESDEANSVLKKILNSGVIVKEFEEILPTVNDIFIEQVEK